VARDVLERWPAAPAAALRGEDPAFLEALPIDHRVGVAPLQGGSAAGVEAQARFLDARLSSYDERTQPEAEVTSGLSPYLHFGHVGAHGVVADLLEREDWSPSALGKGASGKREGWWGTSAAAEAFLDQIVTWRELGYVFCWHRPDDYDRFDALPDWARATLTKHARDRREHSYSLAELEHAQTHDELWNAAQTQLVREGTIHNYLRMLWGKKILEWCDSPRRALAIAIELNNKYALDGRNPNSYSGIFWTFGRFDRPWGPEREVFGTVRYMSSANTARKVRVKGYVAEKLTPGRGLFDPPAQ
jgi:deoxyribodipyrimidine photo-lyase